MLFVALTEMGIAVYDGEAVVKAVEFSDKTSQYLAVREREGVSKELVRYLLNSACTVNDESLLSILKSKDVDAQQATEQDVRRVQSEKPQVLVEAGFAEDERDALQKLRDFAISLASKKIAETSQSPDLHIAQAVGMLDETERTVNLLSSRLREWYGLHFPELDNMVDGIHGYAKVVAAGKRDDITKEVFEEAGFPDSKVEMLLLVLEKSKGGDISDRNLAVLQNIAGQMLSMYDLRKEIELILEEEMERVAPNLSAILGKNLGARMLTKAGSLKRLAAMPSSTIQILGAEKALFRSIKTGAQPPKHGLLFQHALVHAAPRWQRGRIARTIAAKAAIAARVDVYGGGLNETLLERLNTRVREISAKYEEPPPTRAPPQTRKAHGAKMEQSRPTGSRYHKRKKKRGFARR